MKRKPKATDERLPGLVSRYAKLKARNDKAFQQLRMLQSEILQLMQPGDSIEFEPGKVLTIHDQFDTDKSILFKTTSYPRYEFTITEVTR